VVCKMKNAGTKLRQLMKEKDYLIAPCAFDCLSAIAIEKAGFKVAGTTGQGLHATLIGQPDNGLLAFNEMLNACSNIADSINIPILADAEGGYGNALSVIRTVKSFEKTGVAGIFIEDQKLPPNCPFIKPAEYISIDQMVGKIKAAVEAKGDKDFVIVARTDAPFEEGIERAQAYLEAGADMIKPIPKSVKELEMWPQKVKGPLHVGFMSNVNSGITAKEIGQMGYKFITFPLNMLFMYTKACQRYLETVFKKETDEELKDEFLEFMEFQKFIGMDEYVENQKKYIFD